MYESIIKEASEKYGVPQSLIKEVIQAESSFNPNATSPAGAQGLMQLMPSTAQGLGVSNPYDPYENIMGGTKYLAQGLKTNNGSIALTLASYNAGQGAVNKYGGIPPYKETQNYVSKIMSALGFSNWNTKTNVSELGGNVSTGGNVTENSQTVHTENSSQNTGFFGKIIVGVFTVGCFILGCVFLMNSLGLKGVVHK